MLELREEILLTGGGRAYGGAVKVGPARVVPISK